MPIGQADKRKPKGARVLPSGITYKNGRFWLRVMWQGRQVSCGMYDDLEAAEAAKTLYERDVLIGTFEPPAQRRKRLKAEREAEDARSMTVRQLSEMWLESRRERGLAPGSLVTYSSNLEHVLPTFGERRVTDIVDADISAILDAPGLAGKDTQRLNVFRTLRAMFNYGAAKHLGGLENVPDALRESKVKRGADEETLDEKYMASSEEVDKFALALPEPLRLAAYLAGWCALRKGELLGLCRSDFVNLEGSLPVIHVQRQWNAKTSPPSYTKPKGGKARRVAIPAALVPIIREHLAEHVGPDPGAPVFASSIDPERPMSHNSFGQRWNAAREEVRPGFKFHNMRHTGLTAFARTGATGADIMRRGGHSNAEVASRYQHSELKRQHDLAEQLPITITGAAGASADRSEDADKVANLLEELRAIVTTSADPTLRTMIVHALAGDGSKQEGGGNSGE